MEKKLATKPYKACEILYTLCLISSSWEDMYDKIKKKEPIKEAYCVPEDVITILDDKYPEIFKHSYKPPFAFQYQGDLSLFNCEEIVGVIKHKEIDISAFIKDKTFISKIDDSFDICKNKEHLLIKMFHSINDEEKWFYSFCDSIGVIGNASSELADILNNVSTSTKLEEDKGVPQA